MQIFVASIWRLRTKAMLWKAIAVSSLTITLLTPQPASAQVFFNHTPIALADAGVNSTDGGNVFFVTQYGVLQRHFDSSSNSWTTSTSLGNPTMFSSQTWDPSLVGLAYPQQQQGSQERINLYINEGNNANQVLEYWMWRRQIPSNWTQNTHDWSMTDFYPKTAFSHGNQLNFFGTDQPGHQPFLPAPGMTARFLKEWYWSGSNWTLSPAPGLNPVSSNPSFASPILLGPQGSAWDDARDLGVVAITHFRPARSDAPQPQPEIACRVWENGAWRWEMIEKPNANVRRLRAPVIVMREYEEGSCSICGTTLVKRPTLFVVGFNSSTNRWELYSIERNNNTSQNGPPNYPGRFRWGTWRNHGAPSNIIQNINPATGLPNGFDLTTNVSFQTPTLRNGVTVMVPRHEFYGTDDSGDNIVQLISDSNGFISWGSINQQRPFINTMKLNSAMVVRFPNNPNRFRLSVPIRLNNDQVWELFFDTSVGIWNWVQL